MKSPWIIGGNMEWGNKIKRVCISGDYDFMLEIVVHDMRKYQAISMNKLASLENIGGTEIKH